MSDYLVFAGPRRLAQGSLADCVRALKAALATTPDLSYLVLDAVSAQPVELDLRGSLADALARLPGPATPAKAGPGRPRLGVVAREVTLLPRHWDWLAAQPGGASVALRKLVEAASRANRARDQARVSLEAAHRFMLALGGDQPGFEEASRALFSGDFAAARACLAPWPEDLRTQAEVMLDSAQHDAFEARED